MHLLKLSCYFSLLLQVFELCYWVSNAVPGLLLSKFTLENRNDYVMQWTKCISVMNLVATHHNCTSPLDYISHHALHTHIPVHHYTNYTAVTIHSLVLIASPHLHLILTLTYKQHTYTHPLRSLVFPWLTFWAFPLFSDSLCLPGLPIYSDRLLPALLTLPVDIFSVCCLPRPCIVPVADSV